MDSAPPPLQPTAPGAPPRAPVLLVDDRPENLVALEALLEPLGHALVTARSGAEALRRLLEGDFAVILMDVQMPGMDGFETATLIKQRERSRHIPIIFVTALRSDERHAFRGYSAGAVDYIEKPFDPDVLRSKVGVFVELYQRGEQIKRQAELLRERDRLEAERQRLEGERELERRYVTELLEAKEAAERASRAKSEFISSVSHELRTPLNAVIGFSKLLLNPRVGPLNEDQAAYTRDIVDSAGHLLELINDILDLSKIEAGKMTLDPSPFALAPLLERSLSVVRERARDHSICLRAEVAPEVAALPPVLADERRLRQVLYNLLSNAVKFTPDGGSVIVGARLEPHRAGGPDGRPWAALWVADTGVGIAPEHQERVFGAFEQVDTSYSRGQQGTGLGLALTRRLVELHGGTISVESAVGAGSRFTVRLPLECAPPAAAAAEAAA